MIPWADGMAEPARALEGRPLTLLFRRTAVRGAAPAWRIALELPPGEPALRSPAPVENERLRERLAADLSPGLALKPLYGHAPMLWVSAGSLNAAGPRTTLALRFEVLADGQPFATGHAWWRADARPAGLNVWPNGELIPLTRVDPSAPTPGTPAAPPTPAPTGHAWSVRITGDPAVARRDPGASRHWTGTLTLPLRVRDADHFPWPERD